VRAHLSIGDLAEATGIPPDTIRVWERRYGRPRAVRLRSGHRRYTDQHLRWLRRVAEAIAAGHRAGAAVRASEGELDALLGAPAPPERTPANLLDLVRRYDEKGLAKALRRDHESLGWEAFLDGRVAPLAVAVGRAWADGELDVRHEHFLSGVLEDLLRSLRLRLRPRPGAAAVLLATLPDEAHGIGLQMAALACAACGRNARILGTGTPPAEIAGAARESGVACVGLSVSLSTGGVATDRTIAELRELLPERVRLVVGGRGARGPRKGVPGVDYCDDFKAFAAFLRGL
jgi:methanogenic corrinoid protein MtbC1